MEKKTKAQRICELERKLKETEAQLIHNYHFASRSIDRASTTKLAGSGVVISLTFLGGKEVFPPVCISGGLSEETIAAIKDDLKRSFDYATELKP